MTKDIQNDNLDFAGLEDQAPATENAATLAADLQDDAVQTTDAPLAADLDLAEDTPATEDAPEGNVTQVKSEEAAPKKAKKGPPKDSKEYKRKKVMYDVLFLVLIFVFVYAGTSLGMKLYESASAKAISDDLAKKHAVPTSAPAEVIVKAEGEPWNIVLPNDLTTPPPALANWFEEMQKINTDIIGHIYIPNTAVNYPVVKTTNNDFYISHTVDKKYNNTGSIFMDYLNDKFFNDQNSVLYGHRRNDHQMFWDLQKFRDKEFYKNNQTVEIMTLTDKRIYRIFSVRLMPADQDYRRKSYGTGDSFKNFYKSMRDGSMVPLPENFTLTPEDKILTLSTCAYDFHDARLVVFCKLEQVQTFDAPPAA